jgi:uncharacterized protein (TIGR02246 family)
VDQLTAKAALRHLRSVDLYLSAALLTGTLVLSAGLTMTGCTAADPDWHKQSSATSDDGEVKKLRTLLETAVNAFNLGDLETYMRLHTDDAIVLGPNRPAVVGRDAVRKSTQQLFERFRVDEKRTVEEIRISGSLAFVRGNYDSTLTPKADQPPSRDTGKYIEILEKQRDGSWKYARSIWNSNSKQR